MSLESHIAELRRKHHDVHRQVDEARLHPSIPDHEIGEMKRRKLAFKDAIYKLDPTGSVDVFSR